MAHHSIFDYKRALSPKGVYVMVGGATSVANQLLFLGPWVSMTSSQKMGLLLHKPNASDLDIMKSLFEAGTVFPVIDRRFPLSEVADAIHMRSFSEAATFCRATLCHIPAAFCC